MREDIGLFRGKRVADGEWVEGNLWLYGEDAKIFDFYEPFDDLDWYQVDPATIGEYTGCKDADGKRIFEGDIIENGIGRRYKIKFGWHDIDNEFTYGWYALDKKGNTLTMKDVEKFGKVIGNIYDNPELLEVQVMKCPKCKYYLEIIRETDWDTFHTYMYPLCRNCGWYSMPVFDNEKQIEVYLEYL